jgi:tRNA(Ile)-lysidine synthase
LLPALAGEGLNADRLALLARRLRRADETIELAVGAPGRIVIDAEKFAALPAEVALRVLGRAIVQCDAEGPIRLGRLEALQEALRTADRGRLRRTLAGALITLLPGRLLVERAPPRRRGGRQETLTTPGQGRRRAGKRR